MRIRVIVAALLAVIVLFSCDSSFEDASNKAMHQKNLVSYTVNVANSQLATSTTGSVKKYVYLAYDAETGSYLHRQVGDAVNGTYTITDMLPDGDYLLVFLLLDDVDKLLQPVNIFNDTYHSSFGEAYHYVVQQAIQGRSVKQTVTLSKITGDVLLHVASKVDVLRSAGKVDMKIYNLSGQLSMLTGRPVGDVCVYEKSFTSTDWYAALPCIPVAPNESGISSYVELCVYNAAGDLLDTYQSSPFIVKKGEVTNIVM